jgi:NifU-like protein involved in Fe-S cluster formation
MSMAPYNSLVRELFANTGHAGSLADAIRADKSEQGVCIEFSARRKGGAIERLRFRAWGCPHVIAAAEAVCAEYEGQTASQLEEFCVTDLMQRLAVPAEKSGRIIVLEDTVRLLGAALRESSSPTEQY